RHAVAVLVDPVVGDDLAAHTITVRSLHDALPILAGAAIAPVDDVAADGVGARVADEAQGQAVGAALVDVGRAEDGDAGGDVVDLHSQGVGPIQEGAVLDDQADGDGVVAQTIRAGVGIDAVGAVAGAAIARVVDVAATRRSSGVADEAQGQAVGAALVDVGRAEDGDAGGDVVDLDTLSCGRAFDVTITHRNADLCGRIAIRENA